MKPRLFAPLALTLLLGGVPAVHAASLVEDAASAAPVKIVYHVNDSSNAMAAPPTRVIRPDRLTR